MDKTVLHVTKYLVLLLLCLLLAACTPTINLGSQPGATGVAGTPAAKPTAQERQIAQSVFDAINKDRASAGLPALQWSDALAQGARQHNFAMMGANELSHQVSGEPELGEREKQQGVQWVQAAENVGYTTDVSENGALSLHKAMMAEQPPDDGHRQNILNTDSNKLGVDILFDSQNGKLWLTEDFAKIL